MRKNKLLYRYIKSCWLEKKSLSRFSGFVLMAFCFLFITQATTYAQSPNKFIRKGNKQYESRDYTDAEANYKKALSKDSSSAIGLFNLGNTLYKQKRYEDAMKQYATSAENSSGKAEQSAANYNIGNTFMEGKKWGKAIKAYQESLLANPSDDEARYNLAYAKAMLKKQNKGGGDNKNDKQKDKNQKDKNQKNKDQDQKNKDQQNKQDQKKDQDEQEKQHPKPEPSNISKQRAEQLLEAAAQMEKKIQDDNKKKEKGVPVYQGKDW